jgi:NAD(P)H-dependent FMN reductase
MSETPIRLAVIIGSTRAGRFGPTVARWFAAQTEPRADLRVDVIDLVDPQDITARLDAADAFVVVTPEYNHSFPAALKAAIDDHFVQWKAKPVAFVSYGGISGGLRAVEHLRLVFAELHAVTIRDTVSFHNAGTKFDAGGTPTNPDECGGAAKILLDQLTWWAHALRDARSTRAYTG